MYFIAFLFTLQFIVKETVVVGGTKVNTREKQRDGLEVRAPVGEGARGIHSDAKPFWFSLLFNGYSEDSYTAFFKNYILNPSPILEWPMIDRERRLSEKKNMVKKIKELL